MRSSVETNDSGGITMGEKGFGNLEQRQQKLNQKKDVLVILKAMIPWENFRALLESIREKPRKSNAGRKPFDVILLFKLMILQQLYNISDEELEYQVNDRLSFMQFLGLSLEDLVPDATTLWLFRQQLTDSGQGTRQQRVAGTVVGGSRK
jgi:transposase, IS5 family